MQLFITDQFSINNKTITISDERILYQCTKVLRYKPSDQITIQHNHERLLVDLQSRDKKSLIGTIIGNGVQSGNSQDTELIVAMVNKRDKMELIAQKATELGITKLSIRNAKRSVITQFSENKLDRLKTIMLEAAEQSRNRHVPEIKIYSKIDQLPNSLVAYQDGDTATPNSSLLTPNSLIVGPEGGFDPSELTYFKDHQFPFVKLGETILRTETAAIVGSRWLKNR